MRAAKGCRFNPAYRPTLALPELEALQQQRDTVTRFMASGGIDRQSPPPPRGADDRFGDQKEDEDLAEQEPEDNPSAKMTMTTPAASPWPRRRPPRPGAKT